MSAGALASNVVFHNRTRNIEIDMHFVREQVTVKKLKVQYVPIEHQGADIFMKPLPIARFELLRSKLNMVEWKKLSKKSEIVEERFSNLNVYSSEVIWNMC